MVSKQIVTYTLTGIAVTAIALLFLSVSILTWPLYFFYQLGKWVHQLGKDSL